VSDAAHTAVRVVLRPDRRQDPDRRANPRGGRRASDHPAFTLSSTPDADDIWETADWPPAPAKSYVH
jgi:hypothetical protein